MSEFLYWPYDEVTLEVSEDHSKVIIACPWLKASIVVTEENKASLEALLTKFAQGLGSEDLGLVNAVFQNLSSHPFCYILPTAKGSAPDQHKIEDDALVSSSLEDMLQRIVDMKTHADFEEV